MSTMMDVRKRVDQMGEGSLITYADLNDLNKSGALALALSRLCRQGVISRLQRGRYYKPKKTKFGNLEPADSEILKALVGKGSYVSGVSAYNRLGLTTQVPNEITIKGSKYSRRTRVGKLQIRYIRNSAEAVSGTSELLQLLDAFKNIKSIPGSNINESFEILFKFIQRLNSDKQKRLAKLALNCKPSIRAMIGAVLEKIDNSLTAKLKNSLNPLTTYKIGLAESQMVDLNVWRIR